MQISHPVIAVGVYIYLKKTHAYNVEFKPEGQKEHLRIAIYFGFGVILLALWAFVQSCGTCVVGHWRPCRAAAMMFVAVAHLRMSKYMTLGLSLRDRRTWASNHCKHRMSDFSKTTDGEAHLFCPIPQNIPVEFLGYSTCRGSPYSQAAGTKPCHIKYTHQLCSLAEETLILHYQLKTEHEKLN